jgi:hypothetical protein
MLLKWLDTQAVDAFAGRMAQELMAGIPPGSLDGGGKKAEAGRRKALDKLLRQTEQFARAHKLNFYTKARLANGVKWALIQAGYPRGYVDDLSLELTLVVSRTRFQPPA